MSLSSKETSSDSLISKTALQVASSPQQGVQQEVQQGVQQEQGQKDQQAGQELKQGQDQQQKQKASNQKANDIEDASAYNIFISKAVDITQTFESDGILTFIRSCRDIDNNTRRKFLYNYRFINNIDHDHRHHQVSMITPPIELPTKVKVRVASPSGEKLAIFMEEDNVDVKHSGSGSKKQIVEIWTDRGMTLSKRIILSNKIHGDVCYDTSWFGSFSWNHDETAIVYSAEMNPPATASFFDLANDKDDVIVGGTNTLNYGIGENWGEKYTSTCRLNLYVLNVDSGNVGTVQNVPGCNDNSNDNTNSIRTTEGGYTLGQAVFSPCGNYVVYTGWDAGDGGQSPRRLGSIYCYQRPCKIYISPVTQLLSQLKLGSSSSFDSNSETKDSDYICVTTNDRLARSPRFTRFNSEGICKLVYLCNKEGFDTHGGCMALHSARWEMESGYLPDSKRELVSVVRLPHFDSSNENNEEMVVAGMSFPGLFLNQLPVDPFTIDNKYALVNTQWGSISKIIRIDLEDGNVTLVDFDLRGDESSVDCHASQRLLCMTSNGDVVVCQSEPNCPPIIGVIKYSLLMEGKGKIKIEKSMLSELSSITATARFDSSSSTINPNTSSTSTYHLISTTPRHGDLKSPVQGILLLPRNADGLENQEPIPLIVVPHGGPHSCTTTGYTPSYAFLCEHGKYAVLHVNYRGSSGFGQSALESLAGNAGSQDVDDVVHLTERVLFSFSDILDSSRVGVCGGSHGGFLAGHLIGQYPDMFKVCAMRNPVCNIATMVSATDIPDWCYIEALGPGQYKWDAFQGPTKDQLSTMWEASPISHIKNVVSPTLIAIGKSDKRVPPSQGIEYYHALRSKGIKTKLLLYDNDDHAIDRVQSEADHWINILKWFQECL